MNLPIPGRTALRPVAALLALALLSPPALADGPNTDADTQSVVACNERLSRLDQELAAVYRQLLDVEAQDSLAREQQEWLQQRDRCATDAKCIFFRYQQRLTVLRRQLRGATAYQPDQTDSLALADLKHAVDAMRQTDGEFPLEKVLARLQIKPGLSSFIGESDGMVYGARPPRLPRQKPADVSASEWRALQASAPYPAGDNNASPTYSLIHIDGRAQRDLIVYSAGIVSDAYMLRQDNGTFTAAARDAQARDKDFKHAHFYSVDERKGNQYVEWISLRGRTYAAYRNRHYGSDTVYLLRPFTRIGKVPTLTVHYRYQLSVPRQQMDHKRGTSVRLDDALHAGLTRALAQVQPGHASPPPQHDAAVCAAADTASGDQRPDDERYPDLHYSFEKVADMPIRAGRQCLPGRLISKFGAYNRHGLAANVILLKAGSDQAQFLTVHGRRTVTGTVSSITMAEHGSMEDANTVVPYWPWY